MSDCIQHGYQSWSHRASFSFKRLTHSMGNTVDVGPTKCTAAEIAKARPKRDPTALCLDCHHLSHTRTSGSSFVSKILQIRMTLTFSCRNPSPFSALALGIRELVCFSRCLSLAENVVKKPLQPNLAEPTSLHYFATHSYPQSPVSKRLRTSAKCFRPRS